MNESILPETLFIAVECADPYDSEFYAKEIYNWIKSFSFKVIYLDDPHGGLQDNKNILDVVSVSQLFKNRDRYLVDFILRRIYLETVVEPTLKRGYFVVVNGFIDNSYAEAMTLSGNVYSDILKMHDLMLNGLVLPDVVFVIDTSFNVSYNRARQPTNRKRLTDFEKNLRHVYNKKRTELLIRATAQPRTHVIIDNDEEQELTVNIMKDYLLTLNPMLKQKASATMVDASVAY